MARESVRDMVIRIVTDNSDFNRGMSQVNSQLQSVSSTMKSVGKQMIAVGATMTGAVAALGIAGAKWSAEVEGVEFMYKQLNDTVKESITANQKQSKTLGMTEHQYKKNATEVATYFKNMGIANNEMDSMTKGAVQLAADLGAVKDIPIDESMRDIKSAMVGNFEAVDKYGVNLSVATLESNEFVKSLGGQWNELNNAQKAQAIYNELTRQGAFANGLAAQEAKGLNSQYNLAKQQFKETIGELGKTLEPVLTPIITGLSNVLTKVKEWVQANPELTRTILVIVAAVGILLTIAGAIIAVIGVVIGIMSVWGTITTIVSVAMSVLGAVVAFLTSPIGIVIAIIVALVLVFRHLWKTNEGFRNFVIGAWNAIKNAAVAVGTGIKNAFNAAIEWVVDKFNWFKDKVMGVVNFVKGLWQGITGGGGNVSVSVSDSTGTVRNANGGIFTGWSKMGNNIFGEAGHEAVVPLTAKGIKTFTDGLGMSGNGGNIIIQEMNVRNDQDIEKVAQRLADLQRSRERARGQGARF